MNQPYFALLTLDYPPEHGGVARYLGGLVEASKGAIDVMVPETHTCTGPGRVQARRMFRIGWWSWWPMVWLLRGLKREGYTHVLVSHLLPVGTAAWLARRLGGLPYTVIVHGLDVRLALSHPRKRALAGRVLLGAERVITNSQSTAKYVREQWPALSHVEVLTPGLAPKTDVLTKAEARAQLGIAEQERVALTVARLVPRKGIDRAIALMAAEPDWRYVVIGDGADRARLESLAHASAPGRVSFLPSCDDQTRDAWLAAADIFLFLARESETDVEGFGIAPLEASQAGLPVLAGRSGGLSEAVLDGETGVLVDPEDASSIREGFHRIAHDPAFAARLGTAGTLRADQAYSWEERWKKLRSWYDHV